MAEDLASEPLHHTLGRSRNTGFSSIGHKLPTMRPIPEKPVPLMSPPANHEFPSTTRFFNGSRDNSPSYFSPTSSLEYNSSPRRHAKSASSIAERALMMKSGRRNGSKINR